MQRLLRNPRTVALLAGGVALFVVALLVPLPGPHRIQEWAHAVGPSFVLLFFIAHVLVTMAPFPRTVFTLSAGLLFGPWLGIFIAVGATTVSAVLTLLLIRALDRDRVRGRLTHPAVHAINRRLAMRGWLAVGSLRLISFAPFSVVNYCSALSAVRFTPYLVATVVGILPGTVGTVLLGDGLTGHVSTTSLVVTVTCLAVGLVGLLVDMRWRVPESDHSVDGEFGRHGDHVDHRAVAQHGDRQ
ncbi:TVP38/TMEM64 family protein [Nocardia arthritidis]|uniref:TVP38/TMEM64 family membrane protein n=1 Tax=Nocardia arthritidis TaxID=228602 RepID=A0A6G9YFN9_9NOCA|nr:TVP38/TMEM64 family protein [Nocardia arthritidis]QIS12039.1 TVP38/TMEM64 family protein [Nocardia arthritidis]